MNRFNFSYLLKLMMIVSLILAETQVSAAPGETPSKEAIEVMKTYVKIQDGLPPPLRPEVLKSDSWQLEQLLAKVETESRLAASQDGSNCNQFFSLLGRSASQMRRLIVSFNADPKNVENMTDSEFLDASRLQVLIASYLELSGLMEAGAEGGFGVLDVKQRTSCSSNWRPTILEQNAQIDPRLAQFTQEAFGIPGLRQMEYVQNRLLQLVDQRNRANTFNFWALTVVGTAVSMAVWQLAPRAGAAMARMLWKDAAPSIIRNRAARYAIRVSALSLEGAAFMYVDRNITSPAESLPDLASFIGSWKDRMTEIKRILDSGHDSPQLFLVHLSRLEVLRYSPYLPWFSQYSDLIKDQVRKFGSVEKAIKAYEK